MAWVEVARGGPLEFWGGLAQYNNVFAEGDRGFLQINTLFPVSASAVKAALTLAGVPDITVTVDGTTLKIYFRKTAWWLPVIIIALASLAIIVVLWMMFRQIGPEATSLVAVAAIAVATAVGVFLIRR